MKIIGINIIIGCALIFSGCRVSKPGAMESEMAKDVKHKITVGGKNTPNPICSNARKYQGRTRTFWAPLRNLSWPGR